MSGYGDVSYAGSVPFGGGLDGTPIVVGGTATEADSVLAGVASVAVLGTTTTETDTAPSGTARTSILRIGGTAVESDEALPGSGIFVIGGGLVVEGDAALGGVSTVGVAGGTGNEADSALHGGIKVTVVGRWAQEVERALGGSVRFRGGVVRWQLHDPTTAETWEFPRNPRKMTSPHPAKQTTVFARNSNFTDDKLGVGRVVQSRQNPYQWSFTGDIRTQQHYEAFRDWVRRAHRLHLTDHLGRIWLVRFDGVDVDEKKPTFRHGWRYEYTAKAIVYGRIS